MNPEIKQLWLDALRSGKYTQGKQLLRPTENSYCCLGVLCQIAEERGICEYIPSDEHQGFTIKYPDVFQDGWGDGNVYEDSELPWVVKQWAGLESESPSVTMNERNIKGNMKGIIAEETKMHLAQLNDSHGYTFNEIADIIEEQL